MDVWMDGKGSFGGSCVNIFLGRVLAQVFLCSYTPNRAFCPALVSSVLCEVQSASSVRSCLRAQDRRQHRIVCQHTPRLGISEHPMNPCASHEQEREEESIPIWVFLRSSHAGCSGRDSWVASRRSNLRVPASDPLRPPVF